MYRWSHLTSQGQRKRSTDNIFRCYDPTLLRGLTMHEHEAEPPLLRSAPFTFSEPSRTTGTQKWSHVGTLRVSSVLPHHVKAPQYSHLLAGV